MGEMYVQSDACVVVLPGDNGVGHTNEVTLHPT